MTATLEMYNYLPSRYYVVGVVGNYLGTTCRVIAVTTTQNREESRQRRIPPVDTVGGTYLNTYQ